jgi:hypothetical protein
MGSQTVYRRRHLFCEHCLATPAPMFHLQMAAGGICYADQAGNAI